MSLRLIDEFNAIYTYDKKIGQALRKKSGYGKVAGQAGGYVESNGYRTLCLGGVRYKWHRIVWMLHHGSMPDGLLDHINGNKDDNRIDNLRPATAVQNVHNRIRNGMLPPGVSKNERGRYCARIQAPDGRKLYLGYYDTPEEAAAAYAGASIVLHGEFAPKLSRAA